MRLLRWSTEWDFHRLTLKWKMMAKIIIRQYLNRIIHICRAQSKPRVKFLKAPRRQLLPWKSALMPWLKEAKMGLNLEEDQRVDQIKGQPSTITVKWDLQALWAKISQKKRVSIDLRTWWLTTTSSRWKSRKMRMRCVKQRIKWWWFSWTNLEALQI